MERPCANRGRGNPRPHRPHHHMGLAAGPAIPDAKSPTVPLCKSPYKKKPVLHSDRLDRGPLLASLLDAA